MCSLAPFARYSNNELVISPGLKFDHLQSRDTANVKAAFMSGMAADVQIGGGSMLVLVESTRLWRMY